MENVKDIISLREYLERVILEQEKHFERLIEEKEKLYNERFNAAEVAVKKAEDNAQKWRENANEWRSTMNDKDKLLLPRSEFTAYKESTERATGVERSRSDKNEGKGIGIQQFIGWILFLVTLIGFLIMIYKSK
jgi:hypothetical protein